MQLHPYILNLIAEDRIADMHARAASDRRVRAARKRRGFRDHVSGHSAPAQPSGWSHSHHEEKQLVSVGGAGSDDSA